MNELHLSEYSKLVAENASLQSAVTCWKEQAEMLQHQNDDAFVELRGHIDEQELQIASLRAEVERLQEHAMFLAQYTEPDELEFDLIERAAGESFRRHNSQIRGTTVTRSDGYESHLIWATKARVETQIRQQLAISQLEAKRLREALDNHSGNYKLSKAECAVINQLLEQTTSTDALDAYVAEKVKEKVEEHRRATLLRYEQTVEITRQRDLAVSELKTIATGFDCDNDAHRYGAYCRKCEATKALAAIKESEATK